MDTVAIVATLKAPLSASTTEIKDLPESVSWIQVRADLIGDMPAEWLRHRFAGKLLYSLRSIAAGGEFQGTKAERSRRLLAASRTYDLVELEFDHDMDAELLSAIPEAKRLIAWHGPTQSASQLRSLFNQMEIPAHAYFMNAQAGSTADGLQPLLLMRELRRKDLTAVCDGPHGLWSRLLSPYLGAPFLFGATEENSGYSGELSVHRLVADYGFPDIRPVRKIFGMVGNRIFKSPSPKLHNRAYRTLDYPALFLPFHVENFQDFWRSFVQSSAFAFLGLSLEGFVMVSPHKEAALAMAGSSSAMARKAGATNVMVRRNGFWEAHTTDPESISQVPEAGTLKAAVVGCGGAGRAVAAALWQAGAEVTLVNRGCERGLYASQLLGLPFVQLSEFWPGDYDLLVNATPVGKEDDCLPFELDSLSKNAVVVDLAYGAKPTPLVAAVLARGSKAIDGYDVLLTQVKKQFQLLSGHKMPDEIGRNLVPSHGDNGLGSVQLQNELLQTLEAS